MTKEEQKAYDEGAKRWAYVYRDTDTPNYKDLGKDAITPNQKSLLAEEIRNTLTGNLIIDQDTASRISWLALNNYTDKHN